MRFFVILIVLGFYFLRPHIIRSVQVDILPLKWKAFLFAKEQENVKQVLLPLFLFLLPAVILVGLIPLLEHRYLGLPYLFVSIVVVAFCLSRKNAIEQFDLYSKQWNEGLGEEYLDEIYDEKIEVEHDKDVHLAARSGLMYSGFQSLSCVLFWYVVSGLLVPVIYRLLRLLNQKNTNVDISSSANTFVEKLIFVVEWVPAVLISFALNLVANKKLQGLSVFMQSLISFNLTIPSLINTNAVAALSLKTQEELYALDLEDTEQRIEFYEGVKSELKLLGKTFERLLILFLAIAATFLIFWS